MNEFEKMMTVVRTAQKIKRYSSHYCDRQHQSFETLAKCLWPKALWIGGTGRYVTLSCKHRGQRSVVMHETLEAATSALNVMKNSSCGGSCHQDHQLIDIEGAL